MAKQKSLREKNIQQILKNSYKADVQKTNKIRLSESSLGLTSKEPLPVTDLTWKAVMEEYIGKEFGAGDYEFAQGVIELQLPRYIAIQMNKNPDNAEGILDRYIRKSTAGDKSLYEIIDEGDIEDYIYKWLRKARRRGKTQQSEELGNIFGLSEALKQKLQF